MLQIFKAASRRMSRKVFDTDGDGRLGKQEMRSSADMMVNMARIVFHDADTDGSGNLTKQELIKELERHTNEMLDTEMLVNLFDSINANGDNAITEQEFVGFVRDSAQVTEFLLVCRKLGLDILLLGWSFLFRAKAA